MLPKFLPLYPSHRVLVEARRASKVGCISNMQNGCSSLHRGICRRNSQPATIRPDGVQASAKVQYRS